MKKALVVMAAALISTSLACPVKKGYIANGLIKNTFSSEELAPVCGDIRNYVAKSIFPMMSWTEVWEVKNTSGGQAQYLLIQELFKRKGYKLIGSLPTQKGKMWKFSNGSKNIVMFNAVNDPIILVSIAGD